MAKRTYGKMEQYGKLTGIIMDILLSRFPISQVEYWISCSNRDELEKRITESLSKDTATGTITLFNSEFFKLTNTLMVLKSQDDFIISEKFIKNFFEPVYQRENRLSNISFCLHIDGHIWEKLQGQSVLGIRKDFEVGVYKLLVDLTNGQIFEKAEHVGIRKIFTYMEGLFIVRQAILSGEVDRKDSKFFVFSKIRKDDREIYRFRVSRQANGHIGINMYEVNHDFEWPAGCGVIF